MSNADLKKPPVTKRFKSSEASSSELKILQGAERSSLATEPDGTGCLSSTVVAGTDKELWLIQLPRDLDPALMHGHTVQLKELQKLDIQDSQDGRSIIIKPSKFKKPNSTCTVLLPSSTPGRLKAGPRLEGQVCVQQSVDILPVDNTDLPTEDSKMVEVPRGLKQRWKPFGWMDPSLVKTEPHSSQHKTHKHKKSKKSKRAHHEQSD